MEKNLYMSNNFGLSWISQISIGAEIDFLLPKNYQFIFEENNFDEKNYFEVLIDEVLRENENVDKSISLQFEILENGKTEFSQELFLKKLFNENEKLAILSIAEKFNFIVKNEKFLFEKEQEKIRKFLSELLNKEVHFNAISKILRKSI